MKNTPLRYAVRQLSSLTGNLPPPCYLFQRRTGKSFSLASSLLPADRTAFAMPGAFPEFICTSGPFFRLFLALIAVFLCRFLRLVVGTLCAAFLHQPGQCARTVQYWAGTEQIVIEGLIPSIAHETRGTTKPPAASFPGCWNPNNG